MADIRSLLEKFQHILQNEEGDKIVIIEVFKKILDKDISRNDITFKSNSLHIRSNSYMKSEICLRKHELLKEMKKQGVQKLIKDIR